MKKRQNKKLCKKAEEFHHTPKHLFLRSWSLLLDEYRGFHLMQNGIFKRRQKEAPRHVLKWMRENSAA